MINLKEEIYRKINHCIFVKCLYEIKSNYILEVFPAWVKILAII